jgi:MFS family permease
MSNSLPPESGPPARSVFQALFLTLFIDLMGFAIIFPLFPAMLDHYLAEEGTTGLLGWMLAGLNGFRRLTGDSGTAYQAVLFGGVLGSLYSFLQFICAPIFGALSDRYGRRPVLLVSIFGILLSYLLWFVAGKFVVLVLARFLGGIMSANISTASAAVADITTERDRAKGMAVIGIAFGLGLIMGPVIGGFSAAIDLTAWRPELAAYGVNPFSMPALIAFVLSAINLIWVALRFPETLPAQGPRQRTWRAINPLTLFHTEAYPGVTRTNLTNFFFLLAFSGVEFSLTFLAAERMGYGPKENGLMLLFVGVVLALTQGTYVRTRSVSIGPKRLGVRGLALGAPALVILGLANNTWVLLLGLFTLAVASALVMPCLSALASIYTPGEEQGRVLGVFRSLGALARAFGPAAACLLYWRLGADWAYYIIAVFLLVPLGLALTLPEPESWSGAEPNGNEAASGK